MFVKSVIGFIKIIRYNNWWQYKAAPLMGLVYLFIYTNNIPFVDACKDIAASTIVIVGIAGLGYVINDYYDIAFDKAVGKNNRVGKLGWVGLLIVLLLLVTAMVLPWLQLPFDKGTGILLLLQFSFYLVYAHPWIRLKEKHFWGAICDAMYGHVLPAIIAIYTFEKIGQPRFQYFISFLVITFFMLFVKGVHNIILHQLEDRKNDKATGFNTFVVYYGPLKSVNLINQAILPFELLLLGLWTTIVAFNVPYLVLALSLFFLVTYIQFKGWKLEFLPYRQLQLYFLYFLNDFYEDWLPLMSVLCLCISGQWMWVFVPIHLLLFPALSLKLWNTTITLPINIIQGVKEESNRRLGKNF